MGYGEGDVGDEMWDHGKGTGTEAGLKHGRPTESVLRSRYGRGGQRDNDESQSQRTYLGRV